MDPDGDFIAEEHTLAGGEVAVLLFDSVVPSMDFKNFRGK